jgi:hypothetical protein
MPGTAAHGAGPGFAAPPGGKPLPENGNNLPVIAAMFTANTSGGRIVKAENTAITGRDGHQGGVPVTMAW